MHAAYDGRNTADFDSEILDALGSIKALPSPGFLRELDDLDPAVRGEAARLSWLFDLRGLPVTNRLEKLLDDPLLEVRVKAAAARLRTARANARAMAVLIEALDAADCSILYCATSSIVECGRNGSIAAPGLKKLLVRSDLTDKDHRGEQLEASIADIRVSAAQALAAVAPEGGEGVAALARLASTDYGAIDALRRLGSKAVAAAPVLAVVAQDRKNDLHLEAFKALAKVDPDNKAIVPALLILLSDDRPPKPDDDQG